MTVGLEIRFGGYRQNPIGPREPRLLSTDPRESGRVHSSGMGLARRRATRRLLVCCTLASHEVDADLWRLSLTMAKSMMERRPLEFRPREELLNREPTHTHSELKCSKSETINIIIIIGRDRLAGRRDGSCARLVYVIVGAAHLPPGRIAREVAVRPRGRKLRPPTSSRATCCCGESRRGVDVRMAKSRPWPSSTAR